MSATLQYFIQLSSLDPTQRLEASKAIIDILKRAERTVNNGDHSEVMVYAVDRLVKSLASSHDCARFGNMLCLIELLKTFPTVQEETIVDIAVANFTTTGNMRQALRDVLFGRLSLCLALIKAHRVTRPETIDYVVKMLFFLANKRSYLSEVTTEGLLLLLQTVSEEHKQAVVDQINTRMAEIDEENVTPMEVSLLAQADVAGVSIHVPECFGDSLMSAKGIDMIKKVFKLACEVPAKKYPPMLEYLLSYAIRHNLLDDLVQKVWLPLMNGDLCLYSILMLLVEDMAKLDTMQMQTILCPDFVKHIVSVSLQKHHPVKKVVTHFMKKLGEKTDSALAIVKCLTGEGGSVYLDKIAGVNTVSTLVQSMTADELVEFTDKTVEVLNNKGHKQWLMELLMKIATADKANEQTKKRIMTLLFSMAYGYKHPDLKETMTEEDAVQRYMQIVLHGDTKSYITTALENMKQISEFQMKQDKTEILKRVKAFIGKSNMADVYKMVLYFLSFEVKSGEESVAILEDALKACDALAKNRSDKEAATVMVDVLIGMLGRPQSQIRTVVNIVWKEFTKTIGGNMSVVMDALIQAEEDLVIEDDGKEAEKILAEGSTPSVPSTEGVKEEEVTDIMKFLEEEEDIQRGIATEKKLKKLNKEKELSRDQQQMQFQLRICELIEIYCKEQCNTTEFIEFIPELLKGCGHFANKVKFVATYNRLVNLCESTSMHAPVVKQATDEFISKSFQNVSQYLQKQKTTLAAQKLLGYYIKYAQDSTPLLVESIKSCVIQQLERAFKRKKSIPFKVIDYVVRKCSQLDDIDVMKTLIEGGMVTGNIMLKVQALDLGYFLLKKVGAKCTGKDVEDMVDKHIEEWVTRVIDHSEQKYALKTVQVILVLLGMMSKSGKIFNGPYVKVAKAIGDNIENLPAKHGALKKVMLEIKQKIEMKDSK